MTVCNVPVKSANSFFDSMCAPDGFARYYNPFGECKRLAGSMRVSGGEGHGVNCCEGKSHYCGIKKHVRSIITDLLVVGLWLWF